MGDFCITGYVPAKEARAPQETAHAFDSRRPVHLINRSRFVRLRLYSVMGDTVAQELYFSCCDLTLAVV